MALLYEDEFEQDTCKCSSTKMWGKSNAAIYWALDVKRCMPGSVGDKFNIVLDIGQKHRLGFTVSDCEAFMDVMRNILDYHVIIVDSINL
uniref:Methyltranfer_dom domain-containing protein n=1 Tax=Heterorhabditis bacteriophora TaxID=37862 RepID=A0A1I7XIN8_HETBA